MNKDITALIADDEAHMRTFMKLLLMDLGIKKVYLMQNGMDAVDAYREYKPDLVLLDINMNVMNGLDALERIKEINPQTKVVMMTAVSTRDAVEECLRVARLCGSWWWRNDASWARANARLTWWLTDYITSFMELSTLTSGAV